MAFSTSYTFGFAAAICVTCSLAVSLAASSLKDIQEVNKVRDMRGSILSAFDVTGLDGDAIDAAFASQIRVVIVDGSGNPISDDSTTDEQLIEFLEEAAEFGVKNSLAKQLGKTGSLSEEEWTTYRSEAVLAVYQQVDNNGTVVAYAVPLNGVGLWGPISGFLALQPDVSTIVGATFAVVSETPGLGYEIVNPPFRDQFAGKRIYEDDGSLSSVSVVKGGVELACPGRAEFCVQGVSGATMTSNGVDHMLEGLLSAYQPYLDQIRAGGGPQ